jgi:AAA15 family ATPase/GTPase
MGNFIEYVKISNFKSIANLELEDCRRINLFIGYPNVGKSNVLEALSLFSFSHLKAGENLNKLVRVENKNELFHDVSKKNSLIETNQGSATLLNEHVLSITAEDASGSCQEFLSIENEKTEMSIRSINNIIEPIIRNIKRYTFQTNNQWKSIGDSQLLLPFGENIIDTLSYNNNVSEVKAWMKQEFAKFRLEFVLDKSSNCLKVQQRLGNDEVKQLPWSSVADTLQRVIFYKTAIASNKNSVLLFEEPEAHAFPPYIGNMMQDIIAAKTNQFFIVTHSPFVTNDFLEYEHLRRETSIYLFDFENGQTIVKRLADEEIDEVYEYGIDLFFNLESFL